MDLVDYKYAVSIARRIEVNILNDRPANVVDAGVRRRVDLKHVHRPALRYLKARRANFRVADPARRQSRLVRLMAIQSLGQNTRRRCLAHAASARKKVSMMQPV